jgi:hypothetical protein
MRRPSRIVVAVMCTVMITAAGLGRTGSAWADIGTLAGTQAVTAANVSSLNPSSGPTGGGTPVTITGDITLDPNDGH